jgi:tripartite-type tricarboxylate transporter receptor subunit TctC
MKVLIAVLLLWSAAAAAQPAYPTKPIRWIVPTGPGSALDVFARRVAPKLTESMGQPVIIDNRPGANSMIAAREVVRSAPDGHTLFQGLINTALNDLIAPDPCCTLGDKFMPVTRLFSTPLVLVVNPGVQAKTARELIAAAKAKPGSLTYASGGAGAITQLLGEWVKVSGGVEIREIPYKAVGAELPDLTGGHVDIAYLAPFVVRDFVNSGKLRALATSGGQRVSFFPDVPTLNEAGFPGVEALGWNGLFVAAGTPREVVERLHQEIAKALNAKDVRDDAANNGAILGGERPEQFGAFVRAEIQKWGKVIKDAGIKVQQ